MGISGVIAKATEILGIIITQRWIAWLSFILAIVIIVISQKVGNSLKKTLDKGKEQGAKDQLDQDRKIIHTDAKIAKKDIDSRSKDK